MSTGGRKTLFFGENASVRKMGEMGRCKDFLFLNVGYYFPPHFDFEKSKKNKNKKRQEKIEMVKLIDGSNVSHCSKV